MPPSTTSNTTHATHYRWLAGAVAGCAETAAMMPFEVTKTRQQLLKSNASTLEMMKDTVKLNGLRGLYYGMPIVLIQTAGKVGIRFSSFGFFKDLLTNNTKWSTSSTDFAAGCLAGSAEAALWITPCERMKVLRQAQIGCGTPRHVGWISTMRSLLKEQGVGGLYRGVTATVVRNGASVGFRFVVYNRLMELPWFEGQERSVVQTVFCGAFVGALSTVLNNPVDVVKSRMQADADVGQKRYSNSWDCFRKLLQEDGARGLRSGLGARLWKISLGQVS